METNGVRSAGQKARGRIFFSFVLCLVVFCGGLYGGNMLFDVEGELLAAADNFQAEIIASGSNVSDVEQDADNYHMAVFLGDEVDAVNELFFGTGNASVGITSAGIPYSQKGNGYLFEMSASDGGLHVYMEGEAAPSYLPYAVGVSCLILFFVLSLSALPKSQEVADIAVESERAVKTTQVEVEESPPIISASVPTKADEEEYDSLVEKLYNELKTPLSSILGYIRIIKNDDEINERILGYAEIAERNTKRLESRLSDMMLYSKLASGDVDISYDRVELNSEMARMADLYGEAAKFMPGDSKLFTRCDREKLRGVLEIIMANAVKHGTSGGKILMRTYDKDRTCNIEIHNLTTEDMSHKIELLTNQKAAYEDKDGGATGLTLPIAIDIIERMGGKCELSFEDELFTVKIVFERDIDEMADIVSRMDTSAMPDIESILGKND